MSDRTSAAQQLPLDPSGASAGPSSAGAPHGATARMPARLAALPAVPQRATTPIQLQGTLEPAILHVRIGDFAAAVALRARTAPGETPLIVGDVAVDRGMVLAASPAARALGVAPGMALRVARKLCPEAMVMPVEPDRLLAAAGEVLDVLGAFTPLVEPAWLRQGKRQTADVPRLARCLGALLDVRGCERLFGPASSIGCQIGAELAGRGYTALVGIATNSGVATVASALAAPGEPMLVPAGQERRFLDGLPLHGNGAEPPLLDLDPDLLAHLQALGVRRIGQLAQLPAAGLRRRFGATGVEAHAQASGTAIRPLVIPPIAETVEAECRLEDPSEDGLLLERELGALAVQLADRLIPRALAATRITLGITDERSFFLDRTHHLKQPVAGAAAIRARAGDLLVQLAPSFPVCSLRLQLAALVPAATQLSLPLLAGGSHGEAVVEEITARLRSRFGPRAVQRARLVAHAVLPEEQVVWDTPGGSAPATRHQPLAVRIAADGSPVALRRGRGSWEAVHTVCSQWRLRTRWWMDTTHRHYYLVETSRGAVLELYQELADGTWYLASRRD